MKLYKEEVSDVFISIQ